MGHASLEPGGSDSLGLKQGDLAWCCLEMAGPEVTGQSSSAGAAIKECNRVRGSCVLISVSCS